MSYMSHMNSLNNKIETELLRATGIIDGQNTRPDTELDTHAVLSLYYQAVTGRFYTEDEQEALLSLLIDMISPISEAEADELRTLTREYAPETVTPMELRNLRLMFMLSENKPVAEEVIVNTMLCALARQKEQNSIYHSRVEWLRALSLAHEDTVEVLFDRACVAYVTGMPSAAAGLLERAASKSLDTDYWRLAGAALSEVGQKENAYTAYYRYAYWNRRAFLPVPAAVSAKLNELAEALGQSTAENLRSRVEAEGDKNVRHQIGF